MDKEKLKSIFIDPDVDFMLAMHEYNKQSIKEQRKAYRELEKAFEEYKKTVYSNMPWYKKIWYKITKRV